jgi:Flp pilus assembly protein CpaB
LLAALCASAAVAAALSALAPSPPTAVQVLSAARDLAGGTRLAPDDLRVVGLAAGVVPSGALRGDADVTGRVLAGPVRRGEPLTDVAFVGSSLAAVAGDGLVATPVRLADAGAAALLHPGDVVDVLAASTSDSGGATAPVVASGVRVLSVPDPETSASGLEEGALAVLATRPSVAAALARAAVVARLSVTIRAG